MMELNLTQSEWDPKELFNGIQLNSMSLKWIYSWLIGIERSSPIFNLSERHPSDFNVILESL